MNNLPSFQHLEEALQTIIRRLQGADRLYGSALGALALLLNARHFPPEMQPVLADWRAALPDAALSGTTELLVDVASGAMPDDRLEQTFAAIVADETVNVLLQSRNFWRAYVDLLEKTGKLALLAKDTHRMLVDALERLAAYEPSADVGDEIRTLREKLRKPVFVSYSRTNRPFAEQLRRALSDLGFEVWRDVHDMNIGDDWWRQIQEAIEHCDTLVLCMSPQALASPVVTQEWHYARQLGKRVMPIIAEDIDFRVVPRWMGSKDWADFRSGRPEEEAVWARFIRQLESPYEMRKVPFMVDSLPPDFVARPAEFEPVVAELVDATHGAVAITAALKGAGGYGKTTLARAVCHDARVRGAFDDGILWVTLGENVTESDMLSKTLDLIALLKGERPGFGTLPAARTALREAMQDRYILLVVDDVWHSRDIQHFLDTGKNVALLITTRNDGVLPANCRKKIVDAMHPDEAVALLSAGLDVGDYQAQFRQLAARLGEWALLLKLANGTLRRRIESGQTMLQALEYADKALTRKGLPDVFEGTSATTRNRSARASLEVSLELLTPELRDAFNRLAIFPEDIDIPLDALEMLWRLDDFDTEERCEKFIELSLLLKYDLNERVIRVHDVVRTYLRDTHQADLSAWNRDFLAAYQVYGAADWFDALPKRAYLWRNIVYHLAESGDAALLNTLLEDFRWLRAKLSATDGLALIADYTAALAPTMPAAPDDGKRLRLIQSALMLSLPALESDKRQLAAQLKGRLFTQGILTGYLKSFMGTIEHPVDTLQALDAPNNATHLQAGGLLIRTLEAHTSRVNGALALTNGHLLSWSDDARLCLWDANGEMLVALEGHKARVNGALELTNGQLLSWSDDKSLRLWNSEGVFLAALTGHKGSVNGALELSEGRILSWSDDKMLRLWNADGKVLAVLSGHTSRVDTALVLSDGRLLSWSAVYTGNSDKTLRLWDTNGKALAVLAGHISRINGARELSDGRILSWSSDKTLRLWGDDGAVLSVLNGHTARVGGAVELSDRRILSWSDDTTLRLWDADGNLPVEMVGHIASVDGALELRDGRLLSWSSDKTLRVWDSAGNALEALNGHTARVTGALELDDGRIVSWSDDKTLRVRDKTGSVPVVLSVHTSAVGGAMLLANSRLLSWSMDKTLRLWNTSGEALVAPEAHTSSVNGLLLLSDGRLLTWSGTGTESSDKTLRLWDAAGNSLATLSGHTASVDGALELSDGRLLSWSWDNTLRLWDAAGNPLAVLSGHTGSVDGALELSDGRLLSWSWDNTLRLWDGEGNSLAVLDRHTSSVTGALELANQRLLSWSADRKLWLWSADGKPLAALEGHITSVNGALGLADGRVLSWSWDKTLRFWQADGALLRIMDGHTGKIEGALTLPDGCVLSWSGDKTLRLWDGEGNPLAVLEGHSVGVNKALALPDGRLLSWGASELYLWNADGRMLSPLIGHSAAINGVLALPNGRALSWSADKTLWLWDTQTYQGQMLFAGDAGINACMLLHDGTLALGDSAGRVMFFRWVR